MLRDRGGWICLQTISRPRKSRTDPAEWDKRCEAVNVASNPKLPSAVSVGQEVRSPRPGTAELIMFDTVASQPSSGCLGDTPVLLYSRQEGQSFSSRLLSLEAESQTVRAVLPITQ